MYDLSRNQDAVISILLDELFIPREDIWFYHW